MDTIEEIKELNDELAKLIKNITPDQLHNPHKVMELQGVLGSLIEHLIDLSNELGDALFGRVQNRYFFAVNFIVDSLEKLLSRLNSCHTKKGSKLVLQE